MNRTPQRFIRTCWFFHSRFEWFVATCRKFFFLHLKFQSEFSAWLNADMCKTQKSLGSKFAWGILEKLNIVWCIKIIVKPLEKVPLVHRKSDRVISRVSQEYHASEYTLKMEKWKKRQFTAKNLSLFVVWAGRVLLSYDNI
jgi:hypothetical protein